MKTKDISFTLGSGGAYQSANAAKIILEGFEMSSPRRDQEVHVESFDVKRLASFVEPWEYAASGVHSLKDIANALIGEYGLMQLIEAVTDLRGAEEVLDCVSKLED